MKWKKKFLHILKTGINISVITLTLFVLIAAIVLFSNDTKGDDWQQLFNITNPGDTTCGVECRSYVTIIVNRLPVASDWVNMSVGVSMDNVDTVNKPTTTTGNVLNTGVLLPSTNSVYNWTGKIGNKDFQVLEYLGKSCVNKTVETLDDNYTVIEKYVQEECTDITQPVKIQDLAQRRFKIGDKINLVIIGKKKQEETVKWGFKLGDAMIDPYWLGLYGFAYFTQTTTDFFLNESGRSFAIRFKTNETSINVSSVCVGAGRVGTSPTFMFSIMNDNNGVINTTPLVNKTGTVISSAVACQGVKFNSNITLNPNSYYWIHVNYSSGTISNSNGVKMYRNDAFNSSYPIANALQTDMTDKEIVSYTRNTGGVWVNDTENGAVFILNYAAPYKNMYGNPSINPTVSTLYNHSSGTNDFLMDGECFFITEKINVTGVLAMTGKRGTPPCTGRFVVTNGTPINTTGDLIQEVLAYVDVPNTWSGNALRGGTLNQSFITTPNSTYCVYLKDINSTCTSLNALRLYYIDTTTGSPNQLNYAPITYDGNKSYGISISPDSSENNKTKLDLIYKRDYQISLQYLPVIEQSVVCTGSSNCVITCPTSINTNLEVGGYNLTFTGSGTTNIAANITGFQILRITNQCRINLKNGNKIW